jgi:xylulokinase
MLSLPRDAFDAAALAAPAGARGLVLVPYLDGERTPNRPEATGVLVGLRSDTDAGHVARAAVEGVVCGLLGAFDAFGAAGVDTGGRLLLVGGGAKSAAYRRVLADLAGRPVVVPRGDELVATGACVQAAAVLHRCPPEDVAHAWGLGDGDVIEPDARVDAIAVRDAYRRAAVSAWPESVAPRTGPER